MRSTRSNTLYSTKEAAKQTTAYRRKQIKAQTRAKKNKNLIGNILAFRRNLKKGLQTEKRTSQKEAVMLRFMEDRAETPKYVCVSCKSVKKATATEITKRRPNSKFNASMDMQYMP